MTIIVAVLIAFAVTLIGAAHYYESKLDKIEAAHKAQIKSIKETHKLQLREEFDRGADTVRKIATDEITRARKS